MWLAEVGARRGEDGIVAEGATAMAALLAAWDVAGWPVVGWAGLTDPAGNAYPDRRFAGRYGASGLAGIAARAEKLAGWAR